MDSETHTTTIVVDESYNEEEPFSCFSFAGAVFTLSNSAIGASLLAVPFAFKKAGIIPAVLLILGFVVLARFICWRLIRYGRRYSQDTYASMVAAALGHRLGLFLAFIILVSLFAGLVGLIVLIGDLVTPIMQVWFGKDSILAHRTYLSLIVSLLFMVPLSTLPSIESLKYSSFLTVASLIFMTMSVLIHCVQRKNKIGIQWDKIVWWNWSWEAIRAVPILWYNSGFIFQAIPTLGPRKEQFTKLRIVGVFGTVSTITTALMCTIGLSGYLTFYETANGNVLTNYAIDDLLIGICRALVAIVVISTYPLFNLPFRQSLFYVWKRWQDFRTTQNSGAQSFEMATAKLEYPSSQSEATDTASDSNLQRLDSFSNSPYVDSSADEMNVALDLESPREVGNLDTTEVTTPPPQTVQTSLLANFLQSIITWGFAFILALVVPDITASISFVGSFLSPVYYFVLPALVSIYAVDRTSRTLIGATVLIVAAVIFESFGILSFFLPANKISPPLPSGAFA